MPQSRRQMKAREQYRRSLLSVVSHDLRTPLTAIEVSLYVLSHFASEDGDEEVRRLTSAAGEKVENVVALTKNLLQIEKHDWADNHIINRAISSVIGTDLSNDLRALLEILEALKAQSWCEPHLHRLNNAIFDTLRLQRLALQLLSMDFADLQLSCTTTNFIVQSAIESVQPIAEREGVEIAQQTDHATLVVDVDRIIQVLVNLLSNAINFSKPGSTVHLKVTARRNQVQFMVEDEGLGTSSEFRPTFGMFQECTSENGTGLGLHICKLIADQHGGTIDCESRKGSGTSFTFSAPIYNQRHVHS